MKSIVTTGHGDSGRTKALSGDDVSKTHPIMECTGSLDELRAHLALVRQRIIAQNVPGAPELARFLLWLLHVCFAIGAQVSDPLNRKPKYRDMDVSEKQLVRLEREQTRLERSLSLPKAFIVSATTPLAAEVDVACTVARRFERSLVALKESEPEFDATDLLAFANRTSDYLFVLARHIEGEEHQAVDYGILHTEE